MDPWQVAQNYGIAAVAGGAIVYYYYFHSQTPKALKGRQAAPARKQVSQKDAAVEEPKKHQKQAAKSKSGEKSANKNSSKSQPSKGPTQPVAPAPEVSIEDVAHEDESEMSAKAFAQQMQKAKQGTNLSRPSQQTSKLRTVKTGNAMASTASSSGEAMHDAPISSAMNAGGVADMLEPAPSGPSSIRITPSERPQTDKKIQKKEQEKPESKKARQNRKKKEDARLARESEERERKTLLEGQRRAAREARGEPAKNGVPIAPAPTSNPWSEQNAAREAQVSTASVNGGAAPVLLDTFDAESTGSSTGGLEASTAATSTYEQDAPSEEDQMAAAVKMSEDESGWNTVAKPKKQKKKAAEDSDGMATPVEPVKPTPAATPAAPKLAPGEKPKGFMALNDEYVQRSDVDPSDASNWDA